MVLSKKSMANNCVHKTTPALASFGRRARHNGFGGFVDCVLPVKARGCLVTHGVSRLSLRHSILDKKIKK
jgi:hypothetical protein